MYYRHDETGTCIATTYVDDGCWLFCSTELQERLEGTYLRDFKATFGDMSRYVNVTIDYNREPGVVKAHQEGYIEDVTLTLLSGERLKKVPSLPVPTGVDRLVSAAAIKGHDPPSPSLVAAYQRLIGVLMYLGNTTRGDCLYGIGMLARASCSPTRELLT